MQRVTPNEQLDYVCHEQSMVAAHMSLLLWHVSELLGYMDLRAFLASISPLARRPAGRIAIDRDDESSLGHTDWDTSTARRR